jgi:hypothetical protein
MSPKLPPGAVSWKRTNNDVRIVWPGLRLNEGQLKHIAAQAAVTLRRTGNNWKIVLLLSVPLPEGSTRSRVVPWDHYFAAAH